jgi:CBS domain-containing protein
MLRENGEEHVMRVSDVMTSDVVTARPEMTLKEAAREMAEHGISGMPVVDDELSVIGVISEADLLAKERYEPDDNHGVLGRLVHRGVTEDERRFDARDVRGAMTAPAVTVERYYPLIGAAERMLERGINRLPVVRRGELIGIVTRADLVRAFARSDDALAADVREIVLLQKELWSDGGTVDVGIAAGEVTLTGQVWHRAHAETLPKMVRAIPGVVSVRSELTWSEED